MEIPTNDVNPLYAGRTPVSEIREMVAPAFTWFFWYVVVAEFYPRLGGSPDKKFRSFPHVEVFAYGKSDFRIKTIYGKLWFKIRTNSGIWDWIRKTKIFVYEKSGFRIKTIYGK